MTGWPPPELAQDDCKLLFRWFASKPDARRLVREHCEHIRREQMTSTTKATELPEAQEPPTGPYNARRIAWELDRTALGDGYYGSAIRAAMDFDCVTPLDMVTLQRYAAGVQENTDHVKLQEIARKLYAHPAPQPAPAPAQPGKEGEREAFIRWYMEYLHTDERLAAYVWDNEHIVPQTWRAARASLSLPAAGQEPVYAFRRKGLRDFCTCDADRYAELSTKPNLFEVQVFYAAPQLAVAAGWVSVDDRLPEPDEPVLAHNGKWTGVAAWMSGEYLEPLERWQDEHREFIEMMGPAITHWMPLPPAPSTEGA